MKNVCKILLVFVLCLTICSCEKNENELLVDKINELENKINTLIDDNSNYSDNNYDDVINNGEGNTTIDTNEIVNTLNEYKNNANDILNNINDLKVPNKRSEVIDLFFKWKTTIEKLDTELDYYENDLENMYRNNELSYTDFRKYDNDIENIEDILDKAEDTLELKTNYDD